MEKIGGQLLYFGASFLWGLLLMCGYDLIEVFRHGVHHGKVAKFIEDWIFWLIAAVLVFQMIFTLNHGIIRNFFVFSFLSGMVLYRKVVKDRFVRFLLSLLRLIFRPYVWIRKKMRKKEKKT